MHILIGIVEICLLATCVQSSEHITRIIGGTTTKIHCYPYMAAVFYSNSFICGSSIISPTWLLSAAHCTDDRGKDPSTYAIRAGSSYFQHDGVLVVPTKILLHTDYSIWNKHFDCMLFGLDEPLVFSSRIKPIPLPPVDRLVPTRASAKICGWGSTVFNGQVSVQLQVVTVLVVAQQKCAERFEGSFHILPSMICAMDRGKDSCGGDSGGPMVVNGTQEGIVSFGYKCADSYYPGVYTRVADSDVREWIRQHSGV